MGRADEVMELGPKTTPPSEPVEELLEARSSQGVKNFLVATSHGVLLGAPVPVQGPALVLSVGARKGQAIYPFDEAAVRHGAGAERGTDSPAEAYARFSKPEEGPAPQLS